MCVWAVVTVRARTGARIAGVTGDHYFTAEPASAARRARSSSPSPAATTGWPRPAGSSPPAGSTRAPRCCCARPTLPAADDHRRPARPRLRLRADRLRAGRPRRPQATVWAVDVNARARELTAANAARLGAADRVRVGRAGRRAGRRRASPRSGRNPPIRIGKDELHALLLRWLPRLAPDGVAWLVVARHLGGDSLHTLAASSRAGRSSGTPARRASGCCGSPGKSADAGRPGSGRMPAWDTWTWPGSGTSCPTAGSSSPTCRSGSARAPRSPWSGRTAPARRRCCGWSPATCRCRPARSRAPAGWA